MLDHGGALGIGADEWLTVGATPQRSASTDRLSTATRRQSSSACAALTSRAFRAGQLSREDAIKRVEVRVF